MGLVDDGLQVAADVIPIPAEDLADVDDHVEFLAAVVEGGPRLGQLDGRRVAPVREADGGPGLYRAAAK